MGCPRSFRTPHDKCPQEHRSSSSSMIREISIQRSFRARDSSSEKGSRGMSIAEPDDVPESSTSTYSSVMSTPANPQLVDDVAAILGIDRTKAAEVVQSFDDFIARPLQRNLAAKRGRDLAKRNPIIYTARGTTTVDEWVDRSLADWETSAVEGHIGTWMEEVARIVSGGFKPGSGVDLQIERSGTPPTIELYAIQTAPNTKSAGGSRSDIDALRRAAGALRAGRRLVEQYVAVLHGRRASSPLRNDPGITKLGSDDAWEKITGIPDFRVRLLRASTSLSQLVTGRAAAEVSRIRAEALGIFGDAQGNLRLDVLADPPSGRKAAPGT